MVVTINPLSRSTGAADVKLSHRVGRFVTPADIVKAAVSSRLSQTECGRGRHLCSRDDLATLRDLILMAGRSRPEDAIADEEGFVLRGKRQATGSNPQNWRSKCTSGSFWSSSRAAFTSQNSTELSLIHI